MTEYIIIGIAGYLFGSIHPSYIIGKTVGKLDIRNEGSNNAGASNVTVVLGWKWGALTAALDIIKGLVYVLAAKYFLPEDAGCHYMAYLSVVIGHIFPFYMGFKGGKGLATTLGAFGGIHFWVLIGFVFVMFAVTFATGFIGIGTLAVTILTFVYTVYLYGINSLPAILNGIVTFVVVCKHIINIKRIIKGEEISLWDTIRKHKKKQTEE